MARGANVVSILLCLLVAAATVVTSATLPLASASSQTKLSAYEHSSLAAKYRKRSVVSTFVVTGASGGAFNGSVPIRYEIRQLQKQKLTWTLYILGLDWMQYTDQSDPLSWYQIMGIHGRPFTPWGTGVGVQGVSPGDEQNGYCTHSSVLFPTWHRPYLALFEQVLYDAIKQIASWYPEGPVRDQYQAAALRFRIPYWDWAAVPSAGETVFPSSLQNPAIDVDGPDGTQTIANPLYSYQFKPLVPSDLPDLSTMRAPSSSDADAVSNNDAIANNFELFNDNLRSSLYNLLVSYENFDLFGTEARYIANTSQYSSIESIHDSVHAMVGAQVIDPTYIYGHMSYLPYSAFDPAFMLHHAMVDRAVAMWQVLYPNDYLTPEPAVFPTYTIPVGQIQNVSSPLSPFFKNTLGDFWTSDKVRSTKTFGYAYEDTALTAGMTTPQLQTKLKQAINRLYGTAATAGYKRSSTPSTRQEDSSTYREWVANILVKKSQISGATYINLYFNNPTAITTESAPTLMGTHAFQAHIGSCDSCGDAVEITAVIPLTIALWKLSTNVLPTLNPADVVPLLQSYLRYSITTENGVGAPATTVPSLQVTVLSSIVKRAETAANFPVWGQLIHYMNVSRSA